MPEEIHVGDEPLPHELKEIKSRIMGEIKELVEGEDGRN